MNILEIKNLSRNEKEMILNGPKRYRLTVPKTKYWEDLLKDVDIKSKNPCIIEFGYNDEDYMAQVVRIGITINAKHGVFKGRKVRSGQAYIFRFGQCQTKEWFNRNVFKTEDPDPEPERSDPTDI